MDFDECIKKNAEKLLSKGYVSCGHGAFCANNVGGYACVCEHGFEAGLNRKCVDIDECLKQDVCQANAECRNSQGSYSCDCLDGYEGDFCVDIDECKNGTNCHAEAECQNNEGNYTCECVEGYFGNGHEYCVRGKCDDAYCPENQKCVSLRTEECECKKGFRFDDHNVCVDIDECADKTHSCVNTTCSNTIGSFQCDCDHGMWLVQLSTFLCRLRLNTFSIG